MIDPLEADPRHEHLRSVADAFAELGERIADGGGKAVESLAHITAARIPGAQWVSVTTPRRDGFATAAATGSLARDADRIQFESRSGPCVDTLLQGAVHSTGDVGQDLRWPEVGQRLSTLGIVSILSYRLHGPGEDIIGALNVYSSQRDAFTDQDVMIGTLLATHGSMAVAASKRQHDADHLSRALESSRLIGTAVGILMATHHLTQQQAFDLMSLASQNSNRKVANIATDIVRSGDLRTEFELPGR